MASVKLRFVNDQRDRNGRVRYWYFRRAGRRWRLPGEPGSEEFTSEYHRLLAATEPGASVEPPNDRRDYPRGSFGGLVNDYLATGEFRTGLKPRTQAEYKRVCEALSARHGHKRVAH